MYLTQPRWWRCTNVGQASPRTTGTLCWPCAKAGLETGPLFSGLRVLNPCDPIVWSSVKRALYITGLLSNFGFLNRYRRKGRSWGLFFQVGERIFVFFISKKENLDFVDVSLRQGLTLKPRLAYSLCRSDLELTAVLLPQPFECWDYRHKPPHNAWRKKKFYP